MLCLRARLHFKNKSLQLVIAKAYLYQTQLREESQPICRSRSQVSSFSMLVEMGQLHTNEETRSHKQ